MMLPEFFRHIDVHTHVLRPDHPAIVCVTPWQSVDLDDCHGDGNVDLDDCQAGGNVAGYSVGIHPWEADKADGEAWAALERMAAHPRVVAIGEAGLDTRHQGAPDMAVQEAVFCRQARLAEQLDKPLIIHCVGAYNRLIELKRALRPAVPWIVHGFRGKPQLAADLAKHGFYISLGTKHNPAVPAAVPADRLLHETDAVDA